MAGMWTCEGVQNDKMTVKITVQVPGKMVIFSEYKQIENET